MSGNYFYKTKSKSRTFHDKLSIDHILEWVANNIQTNDITCRTFNGGVFKERYTCSKYIITVTKVIDP